MSVSQGQQVKVGGKPRPPQIHNRFFDIFPYTGPGTLMGRWMRMFWHPVARSDDRADPGSGGRRGDRDDLVVLEPVTPVGARFNPSR